jgi:hypothetical protein
MTARHDVALPPTLSELYSRLMFSTFIIDHQAWHSLMDRDTLGEAFV